MAEVGAEFAHELNQPLTALMLYLRAAKTLGSGQVSDRTLPVEAIAILEKAAHEAERLADDPWPDDVLRTESVRPWSVWLRAPER